MRPAHLQQPHCHFSENRGLLGAPPGTPDMMRQHSRPSHSGHKRLTTVKQSKKIIWQDGGRELQSASRWSLWRRAYWEFQCASPTATWSWIQRLALRWSLSLTVLRCDKECVGKSASPVRMLTCNPPSHFWPQRHLQGARVGVYIVGPTAQNWIRNPHPSLLHMANPFGGLFSWWRLGGIQKHSQDILQVGSTEDQPCIGSPMSELDLRSSISFFLWVIFPAKDILKTFGLGGWQVIVLLLLSLGCNWQSRIA